MSVFDEKAPQIMRLLMKDFGLSDESAAAIVGNAGYECGGFQKLQEIRPTVPGSRGGWGWMQWTGSRRLQFEAYCRRNALDPASDRANYGWLFVELRTTSEKKAIPAVQAAIGLEAKVVAFERSFLRAGVKNYDKRLDWAERALKAYRRQRTAKVITTVGGAACTAGAAAAAQAGVDPVQIAAGLAMLGLMGAAAFFVWRKRHAR